MTTFTYDGVVGTGDETGLTFSANVPVCTEDMAYAVVILSVAEFATLLAGAPAVHGSPPSSTFTGMTYDITTPEAALVAPYEPGCYPEWEQFANFRFEDGEELYYGTDVGMRGLVAGIGVWRYTTRPLTSGDIIYHQWEDSPPVKMSSVALQFSGVRPSEPPGGPAPAGSGLPVGSQAVAWVATLSGPFAAPPNDCDGALAWKVPGILNFTKQGTYFASQEHGAVFGFARAIGVRAVYTGTDYRIDAFPPDGTPPVDTPAGLWDTWGGTTVLTASDAVDYRHGTDPVLAIPYVGQWKLRVTNGAVVEVDMQTQWACPGHYDISFPPPATAARQYAWYPCATWATGMGRGRTKPRYEGLLGCNRYVSITTDPSMVLPNYRNAEF